MEKEFLDYLNEIFENDIIKAGAGLRQNIFPL